MDGRVFILPARLIGGALLLGGLILVGVAVWQAIATNQFIAGAVRTEGTVIGLEGSDMKQTVFEFQDEHGATHVARSLVASEPPAYDVGDTVPVLYDADDSERARIHDWQLWFLPTILGGVSLCPLLFGALVAIVIPLVINKVWPRRQPESPVPPPPA
jgi:hypothetical protein